MTLITDINSNNDDEDNDNNNNSRSDIGACTEARALADSHIPYCSGSLSGLRFS